MVGAPAVTKSTGTEHYNTLQNNVASSWLRDPGLLRLNLGIGFLFASAASNGYDGSLMNGLLVMDTFNRNLGPNISSSLLGLVIAGISLGGLPSFIPASYVTDRVGRKKALGIGSSLMVVGAVVQAFTKGAYAMLATRIVIGIGLGFSQTSAPTLATELAHPKHRGAISALFQATWYWGAIVAASCCMGTLFLDSSWGWRLPCLLQAVFPGLQLVGLALVPESPRWLVSVGREEEARMILTRYHANGSIDDELVRYEYEEIKATIAAEKVGAARSGFLTFFKTSGNRHRLFICVFSGFMINWVGNGIVSYYLAPILRTVGVTNLTAQAGINLGMQVWNAILSAVGAVCAEKFGRRPLWLTSASGMLGAFVVITALSATFAKTQSHAIGAGVVAFLFVFFGFYDIAFTPLSIAYPIEILPFHLRAKGLSINLTVVFAASFFNQYVNPVAFERLEWKLYFVYVGVLCVVIPVIYFTFPETKGRTLEEIAEVFDGKKPQVEEDGRGGADGHGRGEVRMVRSDDKFDIEYEMEPTDLVFRDPGFSKEGIQMETIVPKGCGTKHLETLTVAEFRKDCAMLDRAC
ncbi:hypothetical protein SAICODRAFT_33384 [Saitoella complicata NRRL Y-17804]|uniref:Major facilitator superfamily (MFS) profile domain-containing protein n=1 Tax=Saitoella complicata (strain BCRC 22490 / CBS 7301 / JCM 7358 / NBRC 10748 / NRRL Y-17804) TaxID=698492 RepID=A0A0E9NCQ2_SAICN|nr:uncharacterized protein SAICODRAFT_33384 [Saitoella complicata NRRL Y-17804]ODQ55363.1 hypothetical protein SAICODRAFT_33384 [Saitoella complicata NRRL Y-17804]GAO47195.1 hypothetical protein G7K_1405-t1 [Saitoella complicata NRRL Y-17804]